MWLLASFSWILLISFVLGQDITGQENDMIPDRPLKTPFGTFCFFTMSELMYTDIMQQVAPSAYRVGPARLIDMKMISSSGYESLWGAQYFVHRQDYSKIIQYASTRDSVSFVSTMEIETMENEIGLCILTDLGLQPNTYPSTQNCDQCKGSGGNSYQPSMLDYQQELAAMGVQDSYFQAMGKLPTMQNSSPTGSGSQQQTSTSPSSTLGADINIGPLSAQMKASPSPSLDASATGSIQPLGASAQTNLLPQQSSLYKPTSTSNDYNQGQGIGYSHQLQNPYLNSSTPPSTTFSNNKTPLYAPFQNQFVPQSSPLQLHSSSAGSYWSSPSTGIGGSGIYQPRTKFPAVSSNQGNSLQSSLIPGFTFASYSGQYSFLSAQGGRSFFIH